MSQRSVALKSPRKLRGTSIADLVANEIELRRTEWSRHSLEQLASHPETVRALLLPANHAPCRAMRTLISVSLVASAFASPAAPAAPIWPWRSSCAEQSGAGAVGTAAVRHPFP